MFADFLVTYTPYVSKVVFQYALTRIKVAQASDTIIFKPEGVPMVRLGRDSPGFPNNLYNTSRS